MTCWSSWLPCSRPSRRVCPGRPTCAGRRASCSPKVDGDPADPLARRPIWLLPMLYRVCAAGRAQIFVERVSSWRGPVVSQGAEELAWALALEMEGAEAVGETLCGAARD
eukprot:6775401-Alexandrium_andersonii.AAC.1